MEPYRREAGRNWTPRSERNSLLKIMAVIQAPRVNRSMDFSQLVLKSVIGIDESSSDKVYKVVDRLTGETYTLKEFNRRYDTAEREEISREIEILKKLDHPNIVKCHEVFYVGGMIFLLFEPMDHGSLAGVKIISEFDLASLGHQVLLGLTYLHQNKISHGDIKPSNIFVNHLEQVKVLYSGKTLSKTPPISTESGAIYDGVSWDLWSVGLCMMKLSKGLNWSYRNVEFDKVIAPGRKSFLDWIGPKPSIERFPWDVEFDKIIAPGEVSTSFQDEIVPKPSIELLSFVLSCTKRDGVKSWTAEELIRHPFFEDLPTSLKEKGKLLFEDASLSVAASSEVTTVITHGDWFGSSVCYEGDEQSSPTRKKTKISIKDEDSEHDLESSEYRQRVQQPPLKRCIEHCTLFLPDCEFEKDKLIQMWIAEDCIELEVTKRMEDIANLYFDTLVGEEAVIPSKFDNVYRQMKYRVNTSKASTLLFEKGSYVRIDAGDSDKISGIVLHLTWHCKTLDQTFFDALKNLKQLRTLVVLEDCSSLIKQLPGDSFLGLKLLRTLDLSHTHISELPGSIGLLESLRYLDISGTHIKRLPESMDRLYFLQTLKLKGCFAFVALPRGFGRLINLRHLDLDVVSQLKSMPRGMGNLIKLQTLQAFLVGEDDRCGIRELKNMNDITGSFCISMLENVSSAKEAKEAALGDKEHIDKLELRWHDHGNEDSPDAAEILECLQPHFYLRELQLTFYNGSKLPSWISNPSYTDLASITLYKCINCDIMPSIGELPSLRILHVVDMNSVKNINTLFCRNHGTKGFNAFPRLEKLTLDNMLNLEEWTGIEAGDLPCLRHVSIRYCPKLKVLPSFSHLCSLQHLQISHCMQLISLPEGPLPRSLESLIIRGCPEINERCLRDQGLDWLKIASVKNIWIDLEKVSLD